MTLYRYNADNLVTEIINPLGQTSRTEWYVNGLKRSQTDITGRNTTFIYNEQGLLQAVRAPEGETTLAYDDYAHCTKLTTPDGRKWQWQYNEAGSLTEAQSPTGSEQFSFDKEGLLQSHQQHGQITRFDYDDYQRPCLAIAPNGAMTQWAQSRLDRMNHHIDANGSPTRFEYEHGTNAPRKGLHLAPVAIIQANGDTQRFEYDQEGLLRKSTNAAGQSQRFEWGPYDLLLAHVDAAGQRYQYQYDHEARLIQVTNPLNQHWQYAFDAAGQLRQERDFAGRLKQYEYTAEGLLATKIGPDGSKTRYQYDAAQRLTQMSSDDCQIQYAYNQAQRVERANVYRAGQLDSELIWTYKRNPASCTPPRKRYTYTHDTCGRMVARSEHQHGFRPRTTHFTWDGFDRLIEVHASDGSRWKYTYDALGRRTSKRCTHAAKKSAYAMPSNDLQEERYLWEGARLAQQSKRYADGTQEFFGWHYAPDNFTPLAVSHQKNRMKQGCCMSSPTTWARRENCWTAMAASCGRRNCKLGASSTACGKRLRPMMRKTRCNWICAFQINGTMPRADCITITSVITTRKAGSI